MIFSWIVFVNVLNHVFGISFSSSAAFASKLSLWLAPVCVAFLTSVRQVRTRSWIYREISWPFGTAFMQLLLIPQMVSWYSISFFIVFWHWAASLWKTKALKHMYLLVNMSYIRPTWIAKKLAMHSLRSRQNEEPCLSSASHIVRIAAPSATHKQYTISPWYGASKLR